MCSADARFSASSMMSSSIRFSLEGEDVDWMTNTSEDRTFSSIETLISPSENLLTFDRPIGTSSLRTTSSERARLLLPAKIFSTVPTTQKLDWGGRDRTCECRLQRPKPYH